MSNSASPTGSSAASPSTNSTSRRSAAARSRARSSRAGTKSTPTTFPHERLAAAIAALPLPQATSSTRSPGTTSSASTNSSETIITIAATTAKSPSDQVFRPASRSACMSTASLIPNSSLNSVRSRFADFAFFADRTKKGEVSERSIEPSAFANGSCG